MSIKKGTREALGKAVKYHREAARLGQKDFDYDQGNLSKVENGHMWPATDSLVYLADRMGQPMSAIWLTAESFLRESSKTPHQRAAQTKFSKLAESISSATDARVAVATFVEAAIVTIPNELSGLAKTLKALSVQTDNADDRDLYFRLANRVESVRSDKRKAASSSRVRVRGG
jgi:hypothetical protein